MAAYILGTEIMGEDLEELILNKTEGIPFFVEEFMKSLKDLGMIEWKDSGYYLAKDIQEVEIPSTIQEVIMARVDSLPDGAKSVLQTGSAIGREFSCELIKRVTGIPTPEMTPHLSVLRDSELLYERGIFPQATYIFRHSLTQEVAYDSLLVKRKQDIHERIGQAIEELYPDRIEEFYEMLAHHYSKSESHEKAYQYLKLSGDKALQRYSNWEAFRLHKMAINVLKQLPDTVDNKKRRLEIHITMRTLMAALVFPEDSLQILEEGEKLSKEIGDEMSLAKIYAIMGMYYSLKGDSLRALEYNERAFWEAEKTEDVERIASTAWTLCSAYMLTGSSLKVVEVAPKVIALLENTGNESEYFGGGLNPYVALLALHGVSMGALGHFKEGEALCEKALHFANELENLFDISYAELWYGILLLAKGEMNRSVEHLENAVKYCEDAQFTAILGISLVYVGNVYHLLGEQVKAREYAERSRQITLDAGPAGVLTMTYFVLGVINLEEGDLENALTNAKEALKLAHNINHKSYEAQSQVLIGRVLGKLDIPEIDKAEEHILQGIKITDEQQRKPMTSQGYLYLGELYADTNQKEKALKLLKKAETAFQEMGMDYWLRRTQEVLERVQG
ncbi:MAG: hypothetical protein AMJ37_00495 [Dehalococcoidia bacterium DG_18]|nr:MAG: hypothetical protein AMJ37_00495 [Dehalococcoidia bacterium DG_18]